MKILINGKEVRQYHHKGNIFIEGRKGSEFSIFLENPNFYAVKAVVSVDGLCVIDGKPAGEKSKGYVIDAMSNLTISGWRISDSQISKFVFNDKRKSLNVQTGNDSSNVGVIGAMFFNEVSIYHQTTPMVLRSNANIGGYVGLSSNNIGTGCGNIDNSPVFVDTRSFSTTPNGFDIIYYDDKKGLESRGIVVDPRREFPNPFPSYSTTNEYVKIPRK